MSETNGQTKPKASLADLRERRQLAKVRLDLRRLKLQRRMMEDMGADGWGSQGPYDDFGGSDLFFRARTDGGYNYVPISVPSDRRHGQRWPLWRTEPELDRIRQQGRLLLGINAYAQGLLLNKVNYTIGKGFAYKAVARGIEHGQHVPEPIKKLQQATQEIIDRFLKRNRWNHLVDPFTTLTLAGTREREAYRRVQGSDGEAFIRLYRQDNGELVVRFLEPEQIRNPPGYTATEGWSFGSQHQMDPFEDVETILKYYARWQDPVTANIRQETREDADALGEFIDAEDVLHLKGPDTPANVKRGITDFSFDTAKALERAAKLQKNISIGAGVRAATAEIWKAAGATQQQMSALGGALADDTQIDPYTGLAVSREHRYAGMIRRVPSGLEPVIPPADQSTAGYVEACNNDLRQGAAGFSAPTYWLGEVADANYSNLETASAPPVKNGECEQEYYKSAFLAVVWKAVAWAIECKKLPPDAIDLIDIQVEAPAVLHRNELEKAQADQIKVQMGSKSPQTCAMEDGLDTEIELSNIEEFKERTGGAGLALELPSEGEGKGAKRPETVAKQNDALLQAEQG